MDENEKPLSQKFWTIDMIALAALNVVLLAVIVAAMLMLFKVLFPPVQAWLHAKMGL